MNKKILKLLFENHWETHVLKNKAGKVVFVGNFRQLRKRFKLQFGLKRMQDILERLTEQKYSMHKANSALFSNNASVYNIVMEELKKKVKDIPPQPGVYQFLNKDGEVIYVGKAKNLKSRVSQYFGEHDNRPQLPYLLEEAANITYTVVTNELESLFLENTLIKKYLPKYNIQLRDDKNYAFITIDYTTQIPQIGYARKFSAEGGSESMMPDLGRTQPDQQSGKLRSSGGDKKSKIKYFGPYSAAWKIRNTLNLIRRIFPYCANKEVSNRPCFYYYLHRCPGVCIGKISLDEYNGQLDRICNFLAGNNAKVSKEISVEMKLASSQHLFEKAGRLRDQLQALVLLKEKQNVILPKPVSWDIVSAAFDQGYGCINLFKIREGKMLDKENFIFEITNADSRTKSGSTDVYRLETQQKFLEQYYLETSDVPKIIYTHLKVADTELIEHIIRSRFSKKTELITPQKGKPLELVKLGETNAEEYLKNWLSSKAGNLDKINTALEELKEQLHLEKIPDRIECYDISNTQGTNPVGSMVVFKQGLPAKSEYRKFKIQGKKTPDDFAMMREMLTRRMARSSKNQDPKTKNWPLPDLIVIDGGKGQLGIAVEVLTTYNLQLTTPVIGLAKRIEEIFVRGPKLSNGGRVK